METAEKEAVIETLARTAARLAGRDPDEYLKMTLGEVTAFDDYMWRYPDFLIRAEAAYAMLDAPVAPEAGLIAKAADRGHQANGSDSIAQDCRVG